MKNLAKYLVLFLVVAMLAGTLAFSVFADEPAEEPAAPTVGQYTAPEGAWTPADDTVFFAVWATEQDYLDAKDPLAVGTTNEITDAHVGNKSDDALTFYVHLFKDCTTLIGGQLTTGMKTKLTINLAGHTLDCPKGFKVGNYSGTPTTAELTLKNGTFNHRGGNMQLRRFSKLYVTNVIYNAGSAPLNYDDNAALVEYRDSILNVTGEAAFRTSTNKGVTPCQYNFINTDVITTNTTVELFSINANKDTTTTEEIVNIRFDKDSSVVRDAAVPLVAINRSFVNGNDTPYYLSAPVNLIFEAGCVLSENIAPVEGNGYSYLVMHWNQSTNNWGPDNLKVPNDARYVVNYDGGFSHGEFAVKVVEPGTNQLISWTNEMVTGGVKLTAKATEGWVPTEEYAGITYGIWASEADFLAGKAPAAWYTKTTISTDEAGTIDDTDTTYANPDLIPGYIRFYADLTAVHGDYVKPEGSTTDKETQIFVGHNQKVIYDLNGYTLIGNVGFRVGGSSASHPNSSVTFRNGVFLRKGGQFHVRQDTQVIFDRVSFIVNASGNTIFYGPQPDLLKFVDSKLLILSGVNFGGFTGQNSSNGLKVGQIIFENTDIEYGRVKPTTSLFSMATGQWNPKLVYDVIFDEKSTIKGDLPDAGLFTIEDKWETGLIDFNVYTELGFQFSDGAAPSFDCTFTPYGGTAGKLSSSTEDGAKFTWLVVIPDTTVAASDTTVAGTSAIHYYKFSTYVGDLASRYQYVELDKDGNIINTWPIGSAFGFDDKTTQYAHADGATFKFFYDTEIKEFGTYKDYDVTFDLNGCKLYRTGKGHFQFGHSMSGIWSENRTVKFINSNTEKRGILDFSNIMNAIQNRPGTTIVFENIDIVLNQTLFTEYGAKSITFTNVHFSTNYAHGSNVIGGGFDSSTHKSYTSLGGVREFVFDNCVFDENVSAARWTHKTYQKSKDDPTQVNYDDNIKVIVKGGTVLDNTYRAPFQVAGVGVKNIEFVIAADTKFTSFGTQIVSIEGEANPTVNLNGYKITALAENADGYFETVDYPTLNAGDITANLTLFVDFKVNFFTNSEKILAMYNADKSEIAGSVFGGKTKYTARFAAHEAADDKTFIVAVQDGDRIVYANLNYSVAKYASALYAADVSEDAKLLVSTAMNYVAEAYTYAGKSTDNIEVRDLANYEWSESTTTANLTSAIKSVQLDLGSGFKLRFNVADDYSGTLVIDGVTYEVVDGNFNGIDYVNVELRAFELYDAVIEIIAGEEVGEYSLADYCDFAENESGDDDLGYLINALYDYCAIAAEYKANHPTLD